MALSTNFINNEKNHMSSKTVNEASRQTLKSSMTGKRQLIPRATVTSSGEQFLAES
jgi:hypothetical protein